VSELKCTPGPHKLETGVPNIMKFGNVIHMQFVSMAFHSYI
jgi:hypothetical protein